LLPDLGVGAMWFRGLAAWIAGAVDLIDVVEVEPPTQWAPRPDGSVAVDDADVQNLQGLGKPILVHGVTCPVGGIRPVDERHRAIFLNAAAQFGAPWASEHLSLNRLRGPSGSDVDTGFLLPPLQTEEVVVQAAQSLRSLQQDMGRPIAFETGVNYLQPSPGEMQDGEFFAKVAEAADCLIVCDLHNLWCNERNGRSGVSDVIASLPLDRICEVHVAGGQEQGGYYLDAHSGLVDDRLYALAAEVVPQLPALRAIVFELMPDYVTYAGLTEVEYRDQLQALRALWDSRGSRALSDPDSRPRVTFRADASMVAPPLSAEAYEDGLRCALKPSLSKEGVVDRLMGDDGIPLYRHLVNRIRLGNLVTALPLSYRLLVLSVGLTRSDRMLEEYERTTETQAWAMDEAEQFSLYAQGSLGFVPHLTEVIRFELAAQQAVLYGSPVSIGFTCDPSPLLEALRRAEPIPDLLPATHHVVVQPPERLDR
jgi:uncharacterized protein (UPF0276 family)